MEQFAAYIRALNYNQVSGYGYSKIYLGADLGNCSQYKDSDCFGVSMPRVPCGLLEFNIFKNRELKLLKSVISFTTGFFLLQVFKEALEACIVKGIRSVIVSVDSFTGCADAFLVSEEMDGEKNSRSTLCTRRFLSSFMI